MNKETNKSFAHQYITDFLNTHYSIAVTKLIRLAVGADINASIYKAETGNGPSYFVKLKQGLHADTSVTLLALLSTSGIEQVIPPIKAIDGKLTQHISNFTLSVYPFVDGQNGFTHSLADEQWIVLGKTLRRVHELDVPLSIQNQIKKETYSSDWREAARVLDNHIDHDIVGDEVALKLQAFIKEHRPLIRHLVGRAEELSQVIREQSSKFVLCHSDIHGGNVLIDQSGAIYIVDWDEPIMAPKERDLMFIGGGVANVWNNQREEDFFYRGYGKTSINRKIIAYYRCERIVQDIVEYAHALLLSSNGGEERQEMYKQFRDMFEPNGVIDIALKTDDELKNNE